MDSVVHLPPGIVPSCDSPPLRCCCGSPGCVVLRHNCAVLEGVEKDVHMAAKLGQALLVRHETYMADATRDRETLTARIAHLEAENLRLENLNAQTISENRSLLEQLETLNTSTAESDARTRVLEANLQASQQAVRRLEIAASRAADMERHISGLEAELEEAHESMFATEEEARGALRRWRAAERTVSDLQDQVEKMEKGAREERERQAEVIARMERQRDLERELGAAAGRLKGAAAARTLGAGGAGGDSGAAVSAFLRDLLQDNASLQLGIAELRELLSSSREEIHTLRECLRDHQPAHDTPHADSSPSTLRAELRIPPSPPARETPSREVHIHHHYHAAAKPEVKKAKKKRQGVNAALFAPLPSTPSVLSDKGRPTLPLSPSTSHTTDFYSAKATESEAGLSCWSPIHAGFESSPSSPRSNPRASVFDRGLESMEPLSPSTSVDVLSPRWRGKRSAPGLVPASPSPSVCAALVDSSSAKVGLPDEHEHSDADVRPSLRRTVSHESIISLGGLDIHTLHSRPSQLTLHRLGGAQAVLTDITAQPTISRSGPRGSSVLRESLASLPGSPSPVTSPSLRSSSARWSGWRPWRLSDGPGPREDDASQVAESVVGTDASGDGASVRTGVVTSEAGDAKDRDKEAAALALARDSLRAPGINQPGAIPGFSEFLAQAKRRVSSRVVPEEVDQEALGDAFE
ncbi:uncharacterized protein DNG_09814 [Cephalotrichum gorgonifer]|uniref:Uncharacterized protein n=1 Tax=Cephalotrichum gorgonifer TaxID=2041049 RepID=A0AAE8N8W0_9PEZI|nr:uncharacterized protein DNG_09814 [Cephalotrichum gorgonifer]